MTRVQYAVGETIVKNGRTVSSTTERRNRMVQEYGVRRLVFGLRRRGKEYDLRGRRRMVERKRKSLCGGSTNGENDD